MGIGMHKTIQDYFRLSGMPRRRAVTSRDVMSRQNDGATPFSKALSAAQSSAAKAKEKGWTIRDYMKRPIHLRHSLTAVPPAKLPRPDPSPNSRETELPREPGETAGGNMIPMAAVDGENGRIQASIGKAAARYNLPPSLIEAVIKAESDYNVRAVSPAGAQGLMQLMPSTAKELGVNNPFDVDQNILGGARYLRHMLDRFKGNIELALSAYNAGPGTVAKFGGQVPYAETQNYIRRVMEYSRQLSAANKGVS